MRTWLRRRRNARCLQARQEGQILLLGLGMVCLVLALLLVSASATAVYLDLKTLTAMADSAAAAAAKGTGEQPYYGDGVGAGTLTTPGVAQAARDDLAVQAGVVQAAGLSHVEVQSAEAQGGTTAVVTLRAHSQPPFLPWGIIPVQGFTLTATATATRTTSQ